MRPSRLGCGMLAAAACVGISATPSRALGQQLELDENSIGRDASIEERSAERRWWINLGDCLADDELRFPLNIDTPSLPAAGALEVWVGPGRVNCSLDSQRDADIGSCRLIGGHPVTSSSLRLALGARQILTALISEGEGCWATPREDSFRLHFLLMDGAAVVASEAFEMGYDLDAPSSPGSVGTRPGDGMLLITFDEASDDEQTRVFCKPIGEAPGASNDECEDQSLMSPGDEPDPELACGAVVAAGKSAVVRDLEPGQTYALAVARYDAAGNPSALSEVTCATPDEAPSGCSVVSNPGRPGRGLSPFALALLALLGRRRRPLTARAGG